MSITTKIGHVLSANSNIFVRPQSNDHCNFYIAEGEEEEDEDGEEEDFDEEEDDEEDEEEVEGEEDDDEVSGEDEVMMAFIWAELVLEWSDALFLL